VGTGWVPCASLSGVRRLKPVHGSCLLGAPGTGRNQSAGFRAWLKFAVAKTCSANAGFPVLLLRNMKSVAPMQPSIGASHVQPVGHVKLQLQLSCTDVEPPLGSVPHSANAKLHSLKRRTHSAHVKRSLVHIPRMSNSPCTPGPDVEPCLSGVPLLRRMAAPPPILGMPHSLRPKLGDGEPRLSAGLRPIVGCQTTTRPTHLTCATVTAILQLLSRPIECL